MKLPLRCAFLPFLLLLGACDNVGRVWDRDRDPEEPPPGQTESIVEVIAEGGVPREGRPKVRATYPEGPGWPRAVPIVVEFSETVNTLSILPSSPQANDARVLLRLRGTTSALPCQYQFLGNGRLLVMRPITELSNENVPTYEVVLLPDARDADGVRFEVPEGGLVLSEFQVNQDEAFTDGRVLAMFPRDNVRDVAREDTIVVVFDRTANTEATIEANMQVRQAGGTPVAGDVALPLNTVGLADGRVAEFTPNARLLPSADYEVVFTGDMEFGTEGRLDFRGRTPFSRFRTVAPAQPGAIVLGNALAGFANKINTATIAAASLDVTVPSDAEIGDEVVARIYGFDASTTGTGDFAFVERSASVTTGGGQTVRVDFTDALGSAADPRFDDGELTFAAQMRRGSQTSGFVHHEEDADPRFDVTPPTLQRAGPPGSANGLDLWTDLEGVAFHGVASERLGAAELTDGVNAAAGLVASDDAGRFALASIQLDTLDAPRAYTLTLTDAAGNLGAAVSGSIVQRGIVTGVLAGTLTVEAFDEATLAPIAGATVVVDPGVPALPASGQQVHTTGADGRVSIPALAAEHTVTIVRAGYDLTTIYATQAAFVSLPLRPLVGATATFTGDVRSPLLAAGVNAVIGNTALASRGVLGLRTTDSAPTTIPASPIVANRPQIVTGFAASLEPTQEPVYLAHGSVQLGDTLTGAEPPGAPAAGGVESRTELRLVPAPTASLASLTWARNFALATGLDTGSLIGGLPRVRVLTSLIGFDSKAIVGLGYVQTTSTPGTFDISARYSLPLVTGFARYQPLLWLAVEAQDTQGRVSRSIALAQSGSAVSVFDPHPIPAIDPAGPPSAAPTVTFVDGFAPGSPAANATYDVIATDSANRRWLVVVPDRDAATGSDTVQFPDLGALTGAGLAPGTWNIVVEGRLWSGLGGDTADDCALTERVRHEVEFARALPVAFTVQ